MMTKGYWISFWLIVVVISSILFVTSVAFPFPYLAIAFGILPFILISIYYFPVIIAVSFIVFSFFRIHEAIPVLYPLRIPQALSMLMAIILLFHLLITRNIKIKMQPLLVFFGLFFALVACGVIVASNKGEAMFYFNSVFIKIGVMTPVIAWMITEPKHFKQTLVMIISAGTLISGVALFNKINGIGLVEGTRVTVAREIGSILGDPNDLALVLLFPFSFCIAVAFNNETKKIYRVFATIAALIVFSALIATQSRGGLLGILSAMGILLWRRVQNKVLFLSCGFIFTSLLFILAGISGRQSGGAAEEGLDASAQGRLYAWEAAFGMALDHPIMGVGINNFYFNYYAYSPHWDGLNHAVHSTWFGILAETGFVGLLVFMSMIVLLLFEAKKNVDVICYSPKKMDVSVKIMAEGLFSGVISCCISGTFLTQGFTWPIYILLALTVALSRWRTNLYTNV